MNNLKIYTPSSPEIIPFLDLSFDWTEEVPGEEDFFTYPGLGLAFRYMEKPVEQLLYDVRKKGRWLPWREVCDLAETLEFSTAPYVGAATISQIIRALDDGIPSEYTSSGAVAAVVGRPAVAERDFIIRIETKDYSG